MLTELAAHLHRSLGILHKQDIQTAATALAGVAGLGDDCAAIPDGDGYLLLASEGMLPQFVASEPWFAGWSAVMVNLSDVAAMGGRPIALVDTLWSTAPEQTQPIWDGMKAAAAAYGVAIVGGHTNCHSPYNALSVAVLGRAKRLISSFQAQVGDVLLMAIDLRGKPHPTYPYWDAATTAEPLHLRENLAILPHLAESGLCDAGKDISMGGLVGTLLMLLETSECGGVLNLDRVPCPSHLPLDRWLTCFPSYGFLLSVRPNRVAPVQACFHRHDLVCEPIGTVEATRQLRLTSQQAAIVFWDFTQRSLTGLTRGRP